MRASVVKQVLAHAEQDDRVLLITGDAGYGVLDEFREKFPDRFLNLGVAEQNTISFAAGLALVGFKVYVYNIIPFLLYRCYEQVRNDVCYQKLPITLIGIGSGVTYAPQGVTHYSVEDVAIARTLPNLVIMSPSDPVEAAACARYARSLDRPVYIRIAKSGEPNIQAGVPKDISKPQVIRAGSEVAVLFHGSVGIEVVRAVQECAGNPLMISMPILQPIDFKSLLEMLDGVGTLISVEENYLDGGLGSILAEWLVRDDLPFKLIKLGIRNEFIHAVRNNQGMRCLYGCASDNILRCLEKVLHNE